MVSNLKRVYLSYNNIVCPLGFTSDQVFSKIRGGESAIEKYADSAFLNESFCAAMIPEVLLNREFGQINNPQDFTKLEKMMLISLNEVINKSKLRLDKRVGLIISTTKGNIDTLENDSEFDETRAYLSELGTTIKNFFQFENEAIVVSNACVSGLLAVSIAERYLKNNIYDHVLIVSGDIVSRFVLTGFQSFQALDPVPCRPYSKNRRGITIGEAAASILVTSDMSYLGDSNVEVLGSSTINDANHISGPSRTGEGLYRAIVTTLENSSTLSSEIDFISAHGTGTIFNDEMEALAFNRSHLQEVPINSLKGYFGHTMGASGLLETIIGMHSLKNNLLISSKGFDELGTSKTINVIYDNQAAYLNTFLKTSSGFGGCNTVALFRAL